jgi:hypothetical protein
LCNSWRTMYVICNITNCPPLSWVQVSSWALCFQILGYGLDDRCSVAGRSSEGNFALRHRFQTVSGAHTASCPMGTGASYPGVKQLGCEADHSPPSSVEVENAWSYASTPHYVFIAWFLFKQELHLHGMVLS